MASGSSADGGVWRVVDAGGAYVRALLALPADSDCKEPNWRHSAALAEPVAALSCVAFALVSGAFARRHWHALRDVPAQQAAWRRLLLVHWLAGVSGVVYHGTLKWWAQFLDRTIIACWPALFANLMLWHTPRDACTLGIPTGPEQRRRGALLAFAAFAVVSCFCNNVELPFFTASLFCPWLVLGVAARRRLTEHTREALVDFALSFGAMLFFLLDEFHVWGFSYWHSLWHLFGICGSLHGSLWLLRHLREQNKRLD